MLRRLPWTVWLHLSWDLWRLVLLTAAVLVTVISFAAAVKPLADGKLGPVETLKFMILAMPPMLQYALPFAACFGATLAYHRWAADNEITACHAGGISHRALLVPALASGVILAVVLLGLSNLIIPRFLRQMAELVTQDASKFIVHAIQRGDAIKLGDRLLYADQVVAQGPDPAARAFERLWLGGLLVVKLDKDGDVEEQASAREASIWLRRVGGNGNAAAAGEGGSGAGGAEEASAQPMTEVIIRPRDAVFERKGVRGQFEESIKPVLIPNTFSDDPKFLSFSELRKLRERPELLDPVDQRRTNLALGIARSHTVDAIRESLHQQHRAIFLDPLQQRIVLHAVEATSVMVESAADGRRRFVLRAMGDRPKRLSAPEGTSYFRDPNVLETWPAPGQSILVERTLSDGRVQRQSAGGVLIRLARPTDGGGGALLGSPDTTSRGVLATLQLLNVSAQEIDESGELIVPDDEAGPSSGAMSEWVLTELKLADDSVGQILSMGSYKLVEEAKARMEQKPVERSSLAPAMNELVRRIKDLMREVISKEHERLAMAVACLVMVLMGTVMAMRLRDSLPLTIYLWAFFPALATVITISAGQQLTHGHGMIGLLVLWGGVAALGAYAMSEFVRLARH